MTRETKMEEVKARYEQAHAAMIAAESAAREAQLEMHAACREFWGVPDGQRWVIETDAGDRFVFKSFNWSTISSSPGASGYPLKRDGSVSLAHRHLGSGWKLVGPYVEKSEPA